MNALRSAVSGSCERFVQDGFDLDLTYITPNLIAMGFPASGIEKTYRNSITDVSVFLNSRHPNSYRVYNLSERSYDYNKFEGRVAECGFPDHHPPPLQLLLDIVNDMLQWIFKSANNVVVVHCVDGKGRTGLVCSCYLLLTVHYGSIVRLRKERELREITNLSIRDFWNARGQGVSFPSQALYIYYFVKVIRRLGRMPTQIPPLSSPKKVFIRRIVLNGVPDFDAPPRGGCTPFLQILPAPAQLHQTYLLYNSSWQRPRFETYVVDPNWSIVVEVNVEVQGDVLVRCFHAKTSSMSGKHMVTMFHFTFNTDFFHHCKNSYRVPKDEVDEAAGNERFPTLSRFSATSRCSDQATRTMQGWLLYKQDGLFKKWKKWWFVAREVKLRYYIGMMDATPPLEEIDLRGASVEICESHEVSELKENVYYFKVVLPSASQRTLIFGVETEEDLLTWIHELGAQSVRGIVVTTLAKVPDRDEDHAHASQQSNQLEIRSTVSSISTEGYDDVVAHYDILLTMCGEMEETSVMSKGVLERFLKMQQLITEQKDNNTRAMVGDFRALRVRFHAFLVKYKQGPAFERLVSARTVIELLRGFHVALDSIEKNVLGESIDSTTSSWMELWEQERQEVEKKLLHLWVANAMNILDELPNQTSQENALLLLNCETSGSWDSSSAQSSELLRSMTQHLVRLSGASVPVVPGWFIPDHEVQRERSHFARGSFGKVYRGRWRSEKVVIKCVDVVTANDERDFSREARVWLRAQHPNVVRFIGACHLTRPCFFVCEEATNGNLVDFLNKNKERREVLTWRLLHGAALGLQFLHQNKIIHGDLKCNQILVSDDFTAKLTDFGMSFVSLESRPATTTGAVRWKAPELLSNKGTAPTFASDVYSFGMCVVEAVSGRVPWQAHLPDIAVVYHLTRGFLPSRPKEFKSDERWKFVSELCAFEPSERLDLAAAIQKIEIFAEEEELYAAGG
ncbi:hypothetical protein PF005_g6923 [Phytophthora fragariae]|uniref:Phosphatidylinositol-3,4,5-trisphosphate 3-phosphatase n=1 Tax=Phytophthora fragariae TaxID=53985 RepID=A0A6A3STN6_9STRA|nr:hypothetical protein PF003_g16576 [Phytophthora fragariae]KAE8942516.1 hypothetical protein PF009_g7739 [Phytophthora fragariae]KAE9123128.1 hypothetical protein PF007_g7185 [Phytophthora fragariae]KAE9123869.1 hypothetical protein PF010_g6239 [Phytophthora fragariae]KAE9221890.1 hypothetical protein PF005_g6923 [Phytophthora fragariae]